MKKVLITGGTGFVGYHLAKLLAGGDYEVVLADNFFRSKRDANIEDLLALPNVKLIEGDLTDPRAWNALGADYDYVYHLASVNGTKLFYEIPHEVLRIGIITTLNALDWFRTVNKVAKPASKILYTSSNEAYAGALEAFGQLPLPTPENVPLVIADPYNPRWSYGGQKLIGELLFIHYSQQYKFRMSIVRPHNFYGPRAGYSHVIPEIVGRISSGEEPFTIFGADETRSFCYIQDGMEAMRLVMESSVTDGGTYNIGTNIETKIEDLIKTIFRIMGRQPNKFELKNGLTGSVKRRLPEVSKIKRDTGWQASTSLDDGLRNTIDWYANNPRQ